MIASTWVRPAVFIGSSSEGLDEARAFQVLLDDLCEVTIWNQSLFRPGSGTLETLVRGAQQFDYAVLFATADDRAELRGVERDVPRDNVIFELGLFMGVLGRDRTFIVTDRSRPAVLPSDLAGITRLEYQSRTDNNLIAALGASSTIIRNAIERLGARPRPAEESKDRASLLDDWGRLTGDLVDGALYISGVDKHDAKREIERCISDRALIPMRYHYSHEASAALWLRYSNDEYYSHQSRTVDFWAGREGREFVEIVRSRIHKKTGSNAFDFISLGPGDGRKDAEIVSYWLNLGADLIYYPYDTSLPLCAHTVDLVRNAVPDHSAGYSFRIKAVVADFTDSVLIRQVFGHRDTPNVVALLGTLGNMAGEVGFLRKLHKAMDADDFLILEVRLDTGTAPDGLDTNDSMRHDFGPLEHYLGMDWDDCEPHVHGEFSRGVSAIPETNTFVTLYDGQIPKLGDASRRVKLQFIHFYDAQSFETKIEDVGFEMVHKFIGPGFLECLLRRSPTG